MLESSTRVPLSPIDEAKMLNNLVKHFGTISNVSVKIQRSGSWIYQRLKLLNLSEETQKKVHSGELSPTKALEP